MQVLEQENYLGYLWMSLDGGMTGKWIEQVSKDYTKYTNWVQNILIDSCTD